MDATITHLSTSVTQWLAAIVMPSLSLVRHLLVTTSRSRLLPSHKNLALLYIHYCIAPGLFGYRLQHRLLGPTLAKANQFYGASVHCDLHDRPQNCFLTTSIHFYSCLWRLTIIFSAVLFLFLLTLTALYTFTTFAFYRDFVWQ